MGNIENTAVNQLIARASGGPMPTSVSTRTPALRTVAIPPLPDRNPDDPAYTTLPAKMPVVPRSVISQTRVNTSHTRNSHVHRGTT